MRYTIIKGVIYRWYPAKESPFHSERDPSAYITYVDESHGGTHYFRVLQISTSHIWQFFAMKLDKPYLMDLDSYMNGYNK